MVVPPKHPKMSIFQENPCLLGTTILGNPQLKMLSYLSCLQEAAASWRWWSKNIPPDWKPRERFDILHYNYIKLQTHCSFHRKMFVPMMWKTGKLVAKSELKFRRIQEKWCRRTRSHVSRAVFRQTSQWSALSTSFNWCKINLSWRPISIRASSPRRRKVCMLVARVFMLAASIKSYKKPLRGARLGKETGNSTTGPVRCVNGLKAHIIGRSCKKSNEQKLSSELLTLKDTKTIVYIIYLYMFVCIFILNHTCVNIDKCEAIHVFTKKKFPHSTLIILARKRAMHTNGLTSIFPCQDSDYRRRITIRFRVCVKYVPKQSIP